MEVSVLIEAVPNLGFRASCGEPVPATGEGATREAAVANLRAALEDRLKAGAGVVRVRVPGVWSVPAAAVWPDDEITRDWLAGIQEARAAADARPDPWDAAPDGPP